MTWNQRRSHIAECLTTAGSEREFAVGVERAVASSSPSSLLISADPCVTTDLDTPVAAVRLCAARAARDGSPPWLHAFPSVRHAASNAVCRKAGFVLVEGCEFEYPPGNLIRSNDWRLAPGPSPAG